jgi:hypothetical protein
VATFLSAAQESNLLRDPYFYVFPYRSSLGLLNGPAGFRNLPFFRHRSVLMVHSDTDGTRDVRASKLLLNEALGRQLNTYAFGSQLFATRAAAERGIRSITPQRPVIGEDGPISITDEDTVFGMARAATIDGAGNVVVFAQLLPDNNLAVFDFAVQRNLETPTVADYLKLQRQAQPSHGGLTEGQAAGIAVAVTLLVVAILGAVLLRSRQRRMQPPHDFTKDIAALPLTSRPYEAPVELNPRSIREGKELGKGAFGSVFAGTLRRPRESRPVALKRIAIFEQPEIRDRALKEMVVLAQFRREPYIVHLVGVMTRGPVLTIVMELCEMGALSEYLKSQLRKGRSEPWSIKLRMARDAARGMAKIHASSILHLDLAARNILLKKDGTCKVGDFGRLVGCGRKGKGRGCLLPLTNSGLLTGLAAGGLYYQASASRPLAVRYADGCFIWERLIYFCLAPSLTASSPLPQLDGARGACAGRRLYRVGRMVVWCFLV